MHPHRGFLLPVFRRYNMKNNSSGSGGIGFCGLLTVLFIALKLTGTIGWSWLWVLAPLWIPIALLVIVMIVIAAGDN